MAKKMKVQEKKKTSVKRAARRVSLSEVLHPDPDHIEFGELNGTPLTWKRVHDAGDYGIYMLIDKDHVVQGRDFTGDPDKIWAKIWKELSSTTRRRMVKAFDGACFCVPSIAQLGIAPIIKGWGDSNHLPKDAANPEIWCENTFEYFSDPETAPERRAEFVFGNREFICRARKRRKYTMTIAASGAPRVEENGLKRQLMLAIAIRYPDIIRVRARAVQAEQVVNPGSEDPSDRKVIAIGTDRAGRMHYWKEVHDNGYSTIYMLIGHQAQHEEICASLKSWKKHFLFTSAEKERCISRNGEIIWLPSVKNLGFIEYIAPWRGDNRTRNSIPKLEMTLKDREDFVFDLFANSYHAPYERQQFGACYWTGSAVAGKPGFSFFVDEKGCAKGLVDVETMMICPCIELKNGDENQMIPVGGSIRFGRSDVGHYMWTIVDESEDTITCMLRGQAVNEYLSAEWKAHTRRRSYNWELLVTGSGVITFSDDDIARIVPTSRGNFLWEPTIRQLGVEPLELGLPYRENTLPRESIPEEIWKQKPFAYFHNPATAAKRRKAMLELKYGRGSNYRTVEVHNEDDTLKEFYLDDVHFVNPCITLKKKR